MTALFPTAVQEIVLSLVFQALGESRINRTYSEYMDIAARLPRLKQLHHMVNQCLQQFNRTEPAGEICRFRAGDERIVFERYPVSISSETIRAALEVAGMRKPRSRRSKPF